MQKNFTSFCTVILIFTAAFLLIPATSLAQINLQDSLQIHLKLDGNTANSGNKTISISSTTGVYGSTDNTGRSNKAMFFNGSIESGMISLPIGYIDTMSAITMAGWICPMQYVSTGQGFFGQDNVLEVSAYSGPNRLRVYHPVSGTIDVNLTGAVGTWYHVAVTCNTTGMKIYVNGTEAATRTGNYKLTSSAYSTNLGGKILNQTSNYLNGKIDDFRIYNRILNSDELNFIASNYSLTYNVNALGSTSLCTGASISVPFTVVGSNIASDNTFYLELSDANGSFTEPVVMGTLVGTGSGTIEGTIPTNIPTGSAYKLRVVGNKPLYTGTTSTQTFTINNPSDGESTLSRGKILEYLFNTDYNDNTGLGNHGTANGGVSFVDDRHGNPLKAIQLNGSSGYIDIPDSTWFGSTPFSVAVWVKPAAYNNYNRVIDFGNGQNSDNMAYTLSQSTTGNQYCDLRNGATNTGTVTGSQIPLNKWSHISVTYDGTNLRLYMNGNQVGMGAATPMRLITRTSCFLGKSNWATDGFANAAYDDFAIWSRQLTENEIRSMASEGSIVSNSPVCSTNTLYLAAPAISGATYNWSGPNGYTSTTREVFIHNATSANNGQYKVTITIDGCSYVDSIQNINVITPSTQSAASFTGLALDTYISANAATLTGTPAGGYYTGKGIADDIFTPSVAGLGTHTILYNYYNTTGACNSTSYQDVVVRTDGTTNPDHVVACSGKFYDSGGTGAQYGNNESWTKTFTSSNAQLLQFTFGTSGIATGDTLFAYDGDSTDAPIIVAYTYSSRFEGFTSSGSSVTFKFVSGASGTATGWNATYACTTTPQAALNYSIGGGIVGACSGNFYDDGGTGNHGDTGDNTQTFMSRDGSRLKFTFTSFNTAGGSDILRVYDGPNTSYPQITSKSGSAGGFTVESTGNAITFYFTKFNNTLTASGWVSSFVCTTPALQVYELTDTVITACSGAFYDDGGANANYKDNSEKTMTFKSANGQYLNFDFSNVNISSSDSLFIYDGPTVNSKLYAIYTGVDVIDDFSTLDSSVTFRFKTNATTNSNGWKATFSCSTTPLAKTFTHSNGVIYTCGGTFYDEGGTGNFGDAGTFTQTYKSYNGNRIKFDFSSFVAGSNDILRVYDGPNNTYPQIAYKSGSAGSFSVESSGDALTFVFTEYTNSATAAGWVANISCTTPVLPTYQIKDTTVSVCAGVLYDDGGSTANYGDNVDKTITFTSPTNEFFYVDFMNASISASDSLFIFDGDDINAPGIGVYTASSRYESFTTTGSSITFRLKTNATTNASGFQINFNCTSTPQAQQSFLIGAGVIYTCNAKFYDDGGASGDHGDNGSFTQTYRSKNGNRLKMDFTSFRTAGGSDILRIYDGPSTSYALLATKSDNAGAFNVESTGDALTVTFSEFTNGTTASGWAADISCTTPVLDIIKMSTDSIAVCDALITDKGGRASNYSDNLNDTLTLCSANEQQLQIIFNYAETSFGTGDSLWIFDGSNVGAPKMGTYVTSSRIGQVVSSGTCLTMVFHSNASANAEGFEGIVSCITTPPTTIVYQLSSGERNICAGILYDNGGTANYTTGTWTQTYTSYNNERIRAAKVTFDVGTNHNLKVYDGPNTSSTLLGTYNNTTPAPAALQSTGSSLTFVFNSSNTASANRAGFQFNMSCFSINPMDIGWLSSPVCAGATLDIPFTLNDTCYTGNQFKAELSDKNGNFTSPVLIGTLNDSVSGTITATIPSNTPSGSAYRVRIYSTNPVMMSTISPNPIVIYGLPSSPVVASTGSLELCQGVDSVILSTTAQSGVNYRWIKDGTTTVGNNSRTYVAKSAGTYTVEVSSSCDTLLSSNSKVVTVTSPAVSPDITASGAVDLCQGEKVILKVTKDPSCTYSWYMGSIAVGLPDTALTVSVANSFTVKLSNVCGDVWAQDTIVTTIKGTAPTTPTISAGSALTFCEGDSVVLSIPTQTGVTYNWKKNDTTAVGTSSNTYTAKDAGTYSIQITNVCGSKNSANTQQVIVNKLPTAASIVANDALAFCAGDSVELSIAAETGVTRQWKKDGNPIGNGATTLLVKEAGIYTVELTNICGTVTSANNQTVTVNALPDVSVITASGSTDLCPGTSVQLFCTSNTGETIAWYKNGSAVQGAINDTLTASTAGAYTVKLSNANNCVSTSSATNISILTAPNASLTSSATSFCPGSGSITLAANTDANATYQWIKDGSTITGINDSLTVAASGVFSAVLAYSNGCTDTSNAITLSAASNPTATLSATTHEICSGSSTTLTAGAISGASYTWFDGGVKKVGPTTSNTYTVNTSGTFTVEVINAEGCKDTSDAQIITVKTLPSTSLSYTATSFCSGGSVLLSAENIGNATYEWFRNNVSLGAASASTTYTATLAGTYKYVVNNGCTSTSNAIALAVNTTPGAAGTMYGPTSFCSGETGDYYIYAVSGATNYKWEIIPSTSGSITTGQGTTDITIAWKNASGQVKVTPNNACGDGTAQTKSVTYDNTFCGGSVLFSANKTNICSGSSVVYTNYTDETMLFGATANWNFGTGASPATAIGKGPHTVIYASAGLKTVTLDYKDTWGFTVATETKNDYINVASNSVSTSEISSTLTIACPDIETFSVTNTLGSTYAWTVPAGTSIVSGQGSNQITVNFNGQLGTVSLIETTAAGCVGATKSLDVDCGVKIEQAPTPGHSLLAYPNPTSGVLYIETETMENCTYALTNIAGQEIKLDDMQMMKQGTRQMFNMSSLANGMYLLTIKSDRLVKVVQVIKQ